MVGNTHTPPSYPGRLQPVDEDAYDAFHNIPLDAPQKHATGKSILPSYVAPRTGGGGGHAKEAGGNSVRNWYRKWGLGDRRNIWILLFIVVIVVAAVVVGSVVK